MVDVGSGFFVDMLGCVGMCSRDCSSCYRWILLLYSDWGSVDCKRSDSCEKKFYLEWELIILG